MISGGFSNLNYSVILKLHEQPKLGETEAVHCFRQLFFFFLFQIMIILNLLEAACGIFHLQTIVLFKDTQIPEVP